VTLRNDRPGSSEANLGGRLPARSRQQLVFVARLYTSTQSRFPESSSMNDSGCLKKKIFENLYCM